ncbi:MAG: hypothetical protein K0B15_03455 [Lentimicrobium sp.]|nr:hypothetical protein [Lentimicrobium sp.]
MKNLLVILLSFLLLTCSCTAGPAGKINNGISASEIIKSIDRGKAIVIKGKIITDDLDFSQVKNIQVFSSSNQVAVIDVPVTFLDCIFMGKVTTNGTRKNISVNTTFMHSLTFEACDFRQEADFDNITVEANVNFTGAIFRGMAKFNNITFKGRNNFFTAFTSEKYFSMQESLIHGFVDFFKSEITGKISFQSTEFRGIARFSDINVNGTTDFSLTRFRDDALFTYSGFAGDFRMTGSVLQGRFDLNSVDFQGNTYLTDSKFFGKVNFSKTSAKGKFDLSQSVFMGNQPDFTEFSAVSQDQVITLGTKIATYNELIPFAQ